MKQFSCVIICPEDIKRIVYYISLYLGLHTHARTHARTHTRTHARTHTHTHRHTNLVRQINKYTINCKITNIDFHLNFLITICVAWENSNVMIGLLWWEGICVFRWHLLIRWSPWQEVTYERTPGLVRWEAWQLSLTRKKYPSSPPPPPPTSDDIFVTHHTHIVIGSIWY